MIWTIIGFTVGSAMTWIASRRLLVSHRIEWNKRFETERIRRHEAEGRALQLEHDMDQITGLLTSTSFDPVDPGDLPESLDQEAVEKWLKD